jgi:hypothetical protein
MLKAAQERKPITSPKLCEAYSAKIEWVRNVIPELKEKKEEHQQLTQNMAIETLTVSKL